MEKGLTGRKRTKLFFSLSHQGVSYSHLEMVSTDASDTFAFAVHSGGKHHVMVANDEAERQAWIQAITLAHQARFPSAKADREAKESNALAVAPSHVRRNSTSGGTPLPSSPASTLSPNTNATPPRRPSISNATPRASGSIASPGASPFFTSHVISDSDAASPPTSPSSAASTATPSTPASTAKSTDSPAAAPGTRSSIIGAGVTSAAAAPATAPAAATATAQAPVAAINVGAPPIIEETDGVIEFAFPVSPSASFSQTTPLVAGFAAANAAAATGGASATAGTTSTTPAPSSSTSPATASTTAPSTLSAPEPSRAASPGPTPPSPMKRPSIAIDPEAAGAPPGSSGGRPAGRSFDLGSPASPPQGLPLPDGHSRKKSHGTLRAQKKAADLKKAIEINAALHSLLASSGVDPRVFNRVLQTFVEEGGAIAEASAMAAPPPTSADAPSMPASTPRFEGRPVTPDPLTEPKKAVGGSSGGDSLAIPATPSSGDASPAARGSVKFFREAPKKPRDSEIKAAAAFGFKEDSRTDRAQSAAMPPAEVSVRPGLGRALSTTPAHAKKKGAMDKVAKLFKKKKGEVVELGSFEEGTLEIHLIEGYDLPSKDDNGFSDPFCRIFFKNHDTGIETKPVESSIKTVTLNPVWDEIISLPFSGDWSDTLHVDVYDFDKYSANDFIGSVTIEMSAFEKNSIVSGWYHLRAADSHIGDNSQGSVHLRMELKRNGPTVAITPPPGTVPLPTAPTMLGGTPGATVEIKSGGEALQKVKVFIGTWNVGNKPPPDDLTPWIPDGYDLYCIGTQECKYNPRGDFASCATDWCGALIRHFGRQYQIIKYASLWEIRLALFARNEHTKHISNVQCHTEATGVGNVLGNKGGVVCSFMFNHTSICFVNSHLAAHQNHTAARNADVARIIANTKVGPTATHTDIVNSFHHIFWLGDLNYRVAWGDNPDAKTPSAETFEEMVNMIDEEKFAQLFAVDQLAKEREAGRVFLGFAEGVYNFRPTFKVARKAGVHYTAQRSPAWCDRVLWKSLAGFPCKQLTLGSSEAIATSDHKPVVSTFEIDTFLLPSGLDKDRGACTLTLYHLKCEELKMVQHDAKKASGKTVLYDTFLEVSGPFLHSTMTLPIVKKSVNPEWPEVPPIVLKYNNHNRLAKSLMTFRVVNVDKISNSTLGRCLIPLNIGDRPK